MSIEDDMPRFAAGLERELGLAHFMINAVPEHLRLRTSSCGLASTAIAAYLRSESIDSELVISRPRLRFDPAMTHVFVKTVEDSPRIIDATYSQFLEYVGLSHAYVGHGGVDYFPADKIAVIPENSHADLAHTLASSALRFVSKKIPVVNRYGVDMSHGPLENAGYRELVEAYGAIWEPRNLEAYEPSEEMRNAAETISRSISEPTAA